ncbi:GNAT family N-acetyltransferase [Peptostreptococcus faecalis]|uniref:GNAT family N-acetyltransferase n=1 Tax=Peptostreptococcus faecalis TaxID=2045015 RepID=UPI000C7DAD06|nr:GNAT family N-acetyltransferase [Peptostreptococcus faecalis]
MSKDKKLYKIKKGGLLVENQTIRELTVEEIEKAMNLVSIVFDEYVAPTYSKEGVQFFKEIIKTESYIRYVEDEGYVLWGCFYGDKIVGVIGVRAPFHISLLFVDKDFHKRGIAKKLFVHVLNFYKVSENVNKVTVNSSPYAISMYHRLGFTDTGREQVTNGIRFTPMEYVIE